MNRELQEKRTLVDMARRFGQEPSPQLLQDIADLEVLEQQQLQREAELRERIAQDITELFGKVTAHELVQSPPDPVAETITSTDTNVETPPDQQPEINIATPRLQDAVSDYLRRSVRESTVVNPEPALARPGKNLEAEIRRLEQWISRIAATGPGSGEVNLRYLDDIDRNSIADDLYLRYESSTKKFTFDRGHKNNFHLQAQSQLTQTSSATSATAMIFEVTDFSNGIYVDGGTSSQLVVTQPGTYNLQFSVQLINTGNTSDRVYIWLSQNGQDVPNSNSYVTVPAKDNANVTGAVIASWNFLFTTQVANEYVQLKWFVEDETHTTIAAFTSIAATATTPRMPAVPSIIATVTPVKVDSA